MNVILKQDVKNLGYKDDIVKVKDGYGLNYLIPKGYAIVATPSNIKMLEEIKKQRAFKEEKLRKEATALAEALSTAAIKVGAKVSETGKIFGSVTNVQLADAIKKLGYEVDRKNILVETEHIKTLGTYTANIKLYKDIKTTIQFEVVEE